MLTPSATVDLSDNVVSKRAWERCVSLLHFGMGRDAVDETDETEVTIGAVRGQAVVGEKVGGSLRLNNVCMERFVH